MTNTLRTRDLAKLMLPFGAAALILAPAGAAAEDGPDAGAAARGRTTFQRYCTACHGSTGKGDGPLANDLRTKPADLTRLKEKNDGVFPFEDVVKSIDGRQGSRGHSADMPTWGDAFQKTQGTGAKSAETAIEEVAHYIWSIQKP